jgi:hypothetical protein
MGLVTDEISHCNRLAERASAQGNRLEAAYQLGLATGLGRWRRHLEGFREALSWANGRKKKAVLWLDGALYLGRQQPGGWRFDLVAGSGVRRLHGRVRDGVAYSRGEALGPVVYLPRDQCGQVLRGDRGRRDALPEVATSSV